MYKHRSAPVITPNKQKYTHTRAHVDTLPQREVWVRTGISVVHKPAQTHSQAQIETHLLSKTMSTSKHRGNVFLLHIVSTLTTPAASVNPNIYNGLFILTAVNAWPYSPPICNRLLYSSDEMLVTHLVWKRTCGWRVKGSVRWQGSFPSLSKQTWQSGSESSSCECLWARHWTSYLLHLAATDPRTFKG